MVIKAIPPQYKTAQQPPQHLHLVSHLISSPLADSLQMDGQKELAFEGIKASALKDEAADFGEWGIDVEDAGWGGGGGG